MSNRKINSSRYRDLLLHPIVEDNLTSTSSSSLRRIIPTDDNDDDSGVFPPTTSPPPNNVRAMSTTTPMTLLSNQQHQEQPQNAQTMSGTLATTNHLETRRPQPSSRGSLFTNFEDVRLSDEEHVYLTAAAQGDVPIIRQSLEETDVSLNINCTDYMGRSALHLAVDSENNEAIEMILDRVNFECIEESLLHAISKGSTKTVRLVIEHPNYMEGAERARRTQKDPFFRTDEKSQFSPDITPLILAAHYNNHEMIQLFLSRGHTIDRPHAISCQCADCVTKQNYDSLKRSRSRLNAYRALASPAYMALSSPDPIMTTFELRQEMKKLAQVEKEFKNEYMALVEQCMNFACELMDLCRGTQEVEAVLSEGGDKDGTRDPLARLKMAMEYEEKKFVAHPNFQQHLTTIWYGPEMGFLQSMTFWKKIFMWCFCVPLVPFFCLLYIITPGTKIGLALRCPASKFITHTLSHFCFLILLAAATFRLEDKTSTIGNTTSVMNRFENFAPDSGMASGGPIVGEVEWTEMRLKEDFRPANKLMTNVQICLMFWVFGLLWIECKQMYQCGMRVYLLDNYNWVDFTILSLYLSSYTLRFLVDHWIKAADASYNYGSIRARDALLARNISLYESIQKEIFFNHTTKESLRHSYFMKALRFDWKPDDPEIVSDVLFAVANVLSIARTTYLMPAFEVLGPLQISLGRMLGDITRFLVLFTLVLFAFMVGLHNLYWYYGSQTYVIKRDGVEKQVHTSEAFQGLPRTLYSLFWSMFGLVTVDSVEIKYPNKENGDVSANSFPSGNHATSVVEGVGMFLFALYHVAIIIVLTNMLIAMMSHSFEAIQEDCDVEWKFARTKLWMNYIDEGNTLPVPFNMIPTPKSLRYVWRWATALCRHNRGYLTESSKRQTFIKKRREKVCVAMDIDMPQTSYAEILQRLVRRYLFKLERLKEEGKDGVCPTSENILTASASDAYYAKEQDSVGGVGENASEIVAAPPDYSEAAAQGLSRGRRSSLVPSGGRRLPSVSRGPLNSAGQMPANMIQLVSLPQLDQVQRSLKVLDVRLQHLHGLAIEEDRLRQDVEHILLVILENQKVLSTVVLVLMSLQEEVKSLGTTLQRHQATNFTLLPLSSSSSAATRTRHDQQEQGQGQGQASGPGLTHVSGRKKSSDCSHFDILRKNSKTSQ